MLLPGPAHPNRPLPPAVLARRYGLDVAVMEGWIAEGLPVDAEGAVDPFAACNWITWHRLAECPVLARAWRGYLLVFAGFLGGDHAERWVRWHRGHALHLPHGGRRLEWWLPRPAHRAWQGVLAEEVLGEPQESGHWLIRREDIDALPTIAGTVDLQLMPRPTTAADDLLPLVTDLASTFRYEYRHHRTGETLTGDAVSGSCCDCVRALSHRLHERGRAHRIVPGIIVHDAFANPHYWLEVEVAGGEWIPVDPSLPAIARMLGADWQAVARAYTGGCDARRVAFAVDPVTTIPGGPTLGSSIGEAIVDGDNAWNCIDWVCGDCSAEFVQL